MTEERKKILEKAAKLKELAERGVGGEKENAQRMYDAYVKKNNITENETKSFKFTKESEYYNMSAAEFFKHIEVDIQMLGYSMLIFALGRFMRNESVEKAGLGLLREAVKIKNESNEKKNEKTNPYKPDFRKKEGDDNLLP